MFTVPLHPCSTDAGQQANTKVSAQERARAEQEFFHVILEDIEAFNQWFADREEEAVMKLEVIKSQLKNTKHADGTDKAKALCQLVELHGEMVLVLNNVMLQYACVSKLLKKHDKRTGNYYNFMYIRLPSLLVIVIPPA